MSDEQNEISVYETRRFEKALATFPEAALILIEDEIERLIDNPTLGETKKGDLSHLSVHKFTINQQQVLLGYSWLDVQNTLYFLQIGFHKNFYQKMKKQRKTDLKLIKH